MQGMMVVRKKAVKGTKPGDLLVGKPTKFDLVINRTTCEGIGLSIPSSVLMLADQVIE